MPDLPLSPAIEHWTVVVLVWVGFGALAGLLATAVFPPRKPLAPFTTVAAGIIGSTIGLLGLHWLLPQRAPNPITPLGFLAATIGALAILTLYRLLDAVSGRRKKDADK
jgi:uncharacterized membrane protein YeaQ/YmgE (transglycosylase-associated protein family)